MKAKTLILAAVIGVMSVHALATPPSDESISQAVTGYKEAAKTLPRGDRAAAAKAVDTALEGISLSEANLGQFKKLAENGMLGVSMTSSAAIDARLTELASGKGVEAVEAAALRISALPTPAERTRESMQTYQSSVTTATLAALHHESFGEALGQAKGLVVLSNLGRVSGEALKSSTAVADLTKAISGDISPDAAARLTAVSGWFEAESGLDHASVEKFRTTALAAVTSAKGRATPEQAALAKRLVDTAQFFDGAYAKGQLVNHAAPELHIVWSNSPSPIKSLADLRGKVVMLDFWATWCGPCVASFPNIRELQARYKDYPVAIVGVTSIQGFHIDQKAADPKARRIDCKDDPAKELGLMPKFISDMEMTWTIAFADENVFNPSYGVFGIPHAVIIDPAGVVRHRGIHPGGDPADEAGKIDALLSEFKLSKPQAPMASKSDEKKGG